VNGTDENGAGDDEKAGSGLITDLNGNYVFSGLAAGAYYTRIPTPPSDFPLTSGVPDTADNQQDGDNNGRQPSGIGTAIRSPIITLTAAGEPAAGMDGDDTNGDLAIDFGLFTCPAITVRPIMPVNGAVGAAYSQLISASGGPELED
jgi:hypothetical protein